MTEKQRWLMRDLESWRDAQIAKVGRYGPPKEKKEPSHVRAARVQIARAETVMRKWDKDKNEPWKRAKDSIAKRVESVKRIILFEKTEDALAAIRGLK